MPHTLIFPDSTLTATVPSRLRRFASMMYEGVLLFAVVFLAGYLLDTLTQSRSGLTLRGLRQGVLFLAIGVYFIMCWRYGGQTLPMKTWNMRLVDRDGRTPRLSRLVARYVMLWPVPLLVALVIQALSHVTGYRFLDMLIIFAPFSIFIWTWIDPEAQFLHDRLLGTRLIHTDAKPRKNARKAKTV
ncbi:RDD family protein [Pusillimonas sp. (ex Stolz et al. 2005)]|uniref:RDD family protein n=1 Tax=Pusillimonas sp. (ex Stolz et al. 2005) TaxID=1979962 RepID=UPI00261D4A0B|nr:RDD family protein [Pusillimonas sp. (ex Stolz et al. 2005)]